LNKRYCTSPLLVWIMVKKTENDKTEILGDGIKEKVRNTKYKIQSAFGGTKFKVGFWILNFKF